MKDMRAAEKIMGIDIKRDWVQKKLFFVLEGIHSEIAESF